MLGTKAIAEAMFGTSDFSKMSEEQRQTVSALAKLAGGLAGGLASGDTAGRSLVDNPVRILLRIMTSLGSLLGW